MNETITLAEAAELLGLTHYGVRARIARGKLPKPSFEVREYLSKRKTAVLPKDLIIQLSQK